MRTEIFRRDFDTWFYSLDLQQLMKLFVWPNGQEANDFIDNCDEAWSDMDWDEKEYLYNKWQTLV